MIFVIVKEDGKTIDQFPIDEPMLRRLYPTVSFPADYFISGGVLPDNVHYTYYNDGQIVDSNLDKILIDSLPTLDEATNTWILNENNRALEYRLEAEKNLALAQLSRNTDALVNRYAQAINIPDCEIQTWTIQNNEALAWMQDNTAKTPLLDSIASARGVDRELLLVKACEKATTYLGLLGYVIGRRQAIEDNILLASTIAELRDISLIIEAPVSQLV